MVVGTGRSCHSPHALKTLVKLRKEGKLATTRTEQISADSDLRGQTVHAIEKAVTLLDEDQISQLVREYLDGDLISTLAARYGVHRTTVTEHLRRRNIPMRAKGMLPSEAEESILLYEEGYSLASIGRHFGVTGNTVKNVLLKSGTRLRGPNELRRGAVPKT